MRKSLGNKRNQIGDGEENRPNQIARSPKFTGTLLMMKNRYIEVDGVKISYSFQVFDDKDFGFNKITVNALCV